MYASEFQPGQSFKTSVDSNECYTVVNMSTSRLPIDDCVYAICAEHRILPFHPNEEVFPTSPSCHVKTDQEGAIAYRLDGIRHQLTKHKPPDTVAEWLAAPNPALGGKSPEQVIAEGNSEWVWQIIQADGAN